MKYLPIIIFIIFIILFYQTNQNSHNLNEIINKLTRQSSRYGIAAVQDKNPLIAVLHANYAAGYLWAIKDISTTKQFKNATGKNFLEFEKKIIEIQDNITKKLATLCPQYAGESIPLLSELSGENI